MAQSGKLKRNILLSVVTFFGTGLISKKMPGTVGSLFATITVLILPKSCVYTFILAVILFCLGWFCCELYIPKFETNRDPAYIVIDEACGIFVGASIIYLFELHAFFSIIVNFVLFRIFDILKPSPIKFLEEYCKNRKTIVSLGVMIDDIVAAIFASFAQIVFLGNI